MESTHLHNWRGDPAEGNSVSFKIPVENPGQSVFRKKLFGHLKMELPQPARLEDDIRLIFLG